MSVAFRIHTSWSQDEREEEFNYVLWNYFHSSQNCFLFVKEHSNGSRCKPFPILHSLKAQTNSLCLSCYKLGIIEKGYLGQDACTSSLLSSCPILILNVTPEFHMGNL